jgi:hypothetical protein
MELPKTYKRKKATYILLDGYIKGNKAFTVYERKCPAQSKLKSLITSYECQILRLREGGTSTIGGRLSTFKPHWAHPSDNDFGLYGWSFMTYEAALRMYLQVTGLKELPDEPFPQA